jgi:hypothetical protein
MGRKSRASSDGLHHGRSRAWYVREGTNPLQTSTLPPITQNILIARFRLTFAACHLLVDLRSMGAIHASKLTFRRLLNATTVLRSKRSRHENNMDALSHCLEKL